MAMWTELLYIVNEIDNLYHKQLLKPARERERRNTELRLEGFN